MVTQKKTLYARRYFLEAHHRRKLRTSWEGIHPHPRTPIMSFFFHLRSRFGKVASKYHLWRRKNLLLAGRMKARREPSNTIIIASAPTYRRLSWVLIFYRFSRVNDDSGWALHMWQQHKYANQIIVSLISRWKRKPRVEKTIGSLLIYFAFLLAHV